MKELTITPEPIHDYCKNHSSKPSPTLLSLIESTQKNISTAAHMQVGHLEGKFLTILCSLMKAKTAVEFGTFTGYSTLSIAEGLLEEGRVTTLDKDPRATSLAQEHWNQSPHGKKIELILGDALVSAKFLEKEIHAGTRVPYDLAFIDADKSGYPDYFELSLNLVRKGGAILVDNVLWSGRVLKPEDRNDRIIDSFNQKIMQDNRIEKVMLPIRDGITLMLKK